MNIVIFGCDNTGKTTLGTRLADKLGGTYVHSLGNVPIEEMIKFMDKEIVTDGSIKIFDRFPIIEEEIYGKILRGGSKYDNYGNLGKGYKEKMLQKIDLFILCDPGLDCVLNWGNREQMEGVIENVTKIHSAYRDLAKKLSESGHAVVYYNYNDYRE